MNTKKNGSWKCALMESVPASFKPFYIFLNKPVAQLDFDKVQIGDGFDGMFRHLLMAK